MDVHQLIAAINPGVFCKPSSRRELKRILQAAKMRAISPDYSAAAAKATPVEPNQTAVEHLEQQNPFRLPAFESPTERHTLIYDAFDESLEAYYFWLLDELKAETWTVDKLRDTFSHTYGSGLSSEMNRRESHAQQEAMKLLREAHSLVQDILRSATPDNPDDGVTLRNSERGRTEVERALLKSKVETLKLYAHWLGPYLKQARQLEPRSSGQASLVNLFNTVAAEITLLAKRKYPVKEDVDQGELPKMFLKARCRDYFSILIIEFKLRAAPERTSPGAYGYRGRVELILTSYALSDDELAVLRRELDRDNVAEVIRSFGEGGSQALNNLVREIDSLVAQPTQPDSTAVDPNPFTSLFDFSAWFGRGENQSVTSPDSLPREDSAIEQVIRSQALLDARRRCHQFYNRCKQSVQMPCF